MRCVFAPLLIGLLHSAKLCACHSLNAITQHSFDNGLKCICYLLRPVFLEGLPAVSCILQVVYLFQYFSVTLHEANREVSKPWRREMV